MLRFAFQSRAHMSVLDGKRIVETGVWVEHKIKTYLEHDRNKPRARSKKTDCPEVIRSQKEKILSNTNIFFNKSDSNCKPVFKKLNEY